MASGTQLEHTGSVVTKTSCVDNSTSEFEYTWDVSPFCRSCSSMNCCAVNDVSMQLWWKKEMTASIACVNTSAGFVDAATALTQMQPRRSSASYSSSPPSKRTHTR